MLARYAREGAKARGSKAVIYDLRGNVGGSDSWPRKWIQSFLGTQNSIETSMLYAQKTAPFCCGNSESLLPEDEGTCFAREVHGTWYEMIFRSSCWLTIIAARPARARYSF